MVTAENNVVNVVFLMQITPDMRYRKKSLSLPHYNVSGMMIRLGSAILFAIFVAFIAKSICCDQHKKKCNLARIRVFIARRKEIGLFFAAIAI